MRGRFSIIVFAFGLLALLVALNAASYVRVEREAELEIRPDRSTLNAGASGTRALYEFLEESGRRVTRWREPPAALARATERARPATFVIVGRTRVEFKPEEVRSLLEWVEAGGRLVVIDRTPHPTLIESDEWRVAATGVSLPQGDVRADDGETLTYGAPQLAPAQPTLLTRDVGSVAPSRYASRLIAERKSWEESAGEESAGGVAPTPSDAPIIVSDEDPAAQNENARGAGDEAMTGEDETPPPPRPADTSEDRTIPDGDPQATTTPTPDAAASGLEGEDLPWQPAAPVFHVNDERGALLLDFARGRGRIVVLSDPFIVANRGINRADNLLLALNVVAGADDSGLIAFDEFHQGRGTTRNEFAAYFAGTPVLAMCAQLFLIAAAVVWTRGRRFGRALPAPRVDRRSKLEFVASMAELQQRARAFDLAIENVYGRTRRALARYGGSDVSAPRATIAAAVAERSGRSRDEIESLMRECEDAIEGAPLTPRQSLALVAALRELERALGIRMRVRQIKQAGAR
ncbi:MAG TPA: DUF4350 domain-containing protein [Pyrinomonadaceae bacterium]|nr:DUF4350 domain-containing protein [Pyrinomonadaceae bacterium]